MIEVGKKAPDFSLFNQQGETVHLSDFLGQKVILYFYPKDNTSACTAQACQFANYYPQFLAKNAVIIAVSRDSVKSHQNFAKKYQLPFLLLADPQKEVHQLYQVLKPKKMFGKEVVGTIRTTLLIDEKGIIRHIASGVNAQENAQDSLALL